MTTSVPSTPNALVEVVWELKKIAMIRTHVQLIFASMADLIVYTTTFLMRVTMEMPALTTISAKSSISKPMPLALERRRPVMTGLLAPWIHVIPQAVNVPSTKVVAHVLLRTTRNVMMAIRARMTVAI